MPRFGEFAPLCTNTPSYPWCNLFYRQLIHKSPDVLRGDSASRGAAPVGINPDCGIPRAGNEGSVANIANILACALSMLIVGVLISLVSRRKAAVGRSEIRILYAGYLLTLPFQLISTGSFLMQGSTSLVVITAIHAGLVAALFWTLLANALVATQVVEDGTRSSLVPIFFLTTAFFVVTTYISLDVALHFTSTFEPSDPPDALRSIPLFVFTTIWPAAIALLYLIIMAYIVLAVLRETRPLWYFILAAALFILSQLAYFLLSKVICKGSGAKVDGSFIATLLETASMCALYYSWKSITEDDWEEYR